MTLTDTLVTIEYLRKEGWTIEPPRRGAPNNLGKGKRVGRPPKNGRRKRGRPPKHQTA
jgi:hypothetical protein